MITQIRYVDMAHLIHIRLSRWVIMSLHGQPTTDTTLPRANSSTIRQKLASSAQTKEDLSGNWLESNEERPAFIVSDQGWIHDKDACQVKWLVGHHMSTTISGFLKTIMSTSGHFFEGIPVILRYRCEGSRYVTLQCWYYHFLRTFCPNWESISSLAFCQSCRVRTRVWTMLCLQFRTTLIHIWSSSNMIRFINIISCTSTTWRMMFGAHKM